MYNPLFDGVDRALPGIKEGVCNSWILLVKRFGGHLERF
jgi:hypothetical protein